LLVANKSIVSKPINLSRCTAILTMLIASSLYFYEFVIRVTPSVLTTPLMAEFHLHANTLGLISACFYFSYMPMQIPAGLLGDYFGPKRMLVTCMLLCAASTLLFAISYNTYALASARMIAGFAASFAYLGPIMLASSLFPPRYLGFIIGSVQALGCLGAISGEQLLAYCVTHYSWRTSLIAISLLGCAFTWLMIQYLPKSPSPHETRHQKAFQPFASLKTILSRPINWHIAAIGLCLWTPMALFAEMWGIPFLSQSYQLSTYDASSMLTVLWIGTAVGGPLWGWLALKWISLKTALYTASMCSLCGSIALIFLTTPLPLAYLCLFFFGAGCAGQCLTFSLMHQHNQPHLIGTAAGFNNMAVIASGSFLQPLAAMLLTMSWEGNYHQLAPHYSVHAYQQAFLLILLSHGILLGLIACLKPSTQTQSGLHCATTS
jgi:MFS family permease